MSAPHEPLCGDYVISDAVARLDVRAIHAYLSRSYWAQNIPLELVQRSVENSLCLGAYLGSEQVGLVRLISDYATFCYVCDVYVLEAHRGKGLSKALMAAAQSHPRLQGLRRWNLVTRDAHGLYRGFGFTEIKNPERYMEKLRSNLYPPTPSKAPPV